MFIVDFDPVVFLDRGEDIPNHGQRAVPQEIDFDQTGIFRLVFLPLDDRHTLGRRLDGHVAINPVRNDDDSAAMHRHVAGIALSACRRGG